jgi:hypothetical protein
MNFVQGLQLVVLFRGNSKIFFFSHGSNCWFLKFKLFLKTTIWDALVTLECRKVPTFSHSFAGDFAEKENFAAIRMSFATGQPLRTFFLRTVSSKSLVQSRHCAAFMSQCLMLYFSSIIICKFIHRKKFFDKRI